jgi:arginyl-tRNA synthetase
MLPLSPFRAAAVQAVADALGVDPSLFAVSAPPDAALGDYAVGVFPAAKALKAAPPALAQRVAAAFQPNDFLASATAAGPYVNFKAQRRALYDRLFDTTLAAQPKLARPAPGAGKTVCIDFSSPNIAKELAYHHIRSTMIGNALVRIHRYLGWKAIGINHLGDWGTTFGMLLAGAQKFGTPEPMTIEALNKLYVDFRKAAKEEPALEDEARVWFKKLEDGDAWARGLWERMREISLAEFQEVYDILGVKFDAVTGESHYESQMQPVIDRLTEKGLTSISEDALVVDLSELKIPPLLLRKKDGATLYATRDLAAAIYRYETFHFDRSLYVVAREQGLHFQQLFAVLKKAGFEWVDRMAHVSFGLVRIGGRKSGTRHGNVVLLREVLGDAEEGIAERLRANAELSAEQVKSISHEVGISAIIFANLSRQRDKDVDFNLEQVTSFEGDAGPYLQYAHARCASVLRKGGVTDAPSLADADPTLLAQHEEWALGRLLLELDDVAAKAAENNEPHLLANYLLDVSAGLARWWTQGNDNASLRILVEDPPVRRARLALAAATRETLRRGLGMLGMSAPDVM